jgi:hypothetical protein
MEKNAPAHDHVDDKLHVRPLPNIAQEELGLPHRLHCVYESLKQQRSPTEEHE